MPTKTVNYRLYRIVLYGPATQEQQWRVVIWPPGTAAPIPMPNHSSEDEAIAEAWAAIDHILNGSAAPKL